jgi:hypothetical protein
MLGACDLAVENRTSPDTQKVLATARDVEALIGGQYLRWSQGVYTTTGNFWGMANVMSFENFTSLANNCQGQRVEIPRAANDNAVGNGCANEQSRVYYIHGEVVRVSSSILAKLDEAGFTLGSEAQDQRARAFGNFTRGLALGYLSLFYDSAAVITPEMSSQDPGVLSHYSVVMEEALAAMDAAIAAASAPGTGTQGFPIPVNWYPASAGEMSAAEFIRVVRSYKARLRANVARTPAERAAVNWAAVIADAQNGITADHNITTSTTLGPNNSWVGTWYSYTTWHQMVPFIIGMGDVSGSYATYISASLNDKGASGPFFMVTPDLRFPQGATRAAQQADFAVTSCSSGGSVCARMLRNRPSANDQTSGPTWGHSQYDHTRFYPWRTSGSVGGTTGQNGPFPFMTKAEIDMLQAEGLIRTGSFAAAAALINNTRVARGGLPAITAFDATSPVPGGANCVPKVPVGPSYNTIACGNLMEALKWEKRLETAYTHFAAWFLDHRGWGDLPEGTPTQWAPPYQDLLARGYQPAQVYSTGGQTGRDAAARGTYGW